LWRCIEHIAKLCSRGHPRLHLGLEPEPLCYLETTEETIRYFDQLRTDRPGDRRLNELLGVNYDCCHLAVEFEEPAEAIARLRYYGIRISKIHLSSALRVRPTSEVLHALKAFADDIYFHQVIERRSGGSITRHKDLDLALDSNPQSAIRN